MPGDAVVFVPGIMGSDLWTEPPGGKGRRCVWEEDISTVAKTILLEPWLIEGHRTLFPGKVFSGKRWGYESLFDYLSSQGYSRPNSLIPFGYDWRLGTSISAQLLTSALGAQNLGSSKIILIGHSMGCLVLRTALPLLLNAGVNVVKLIELAPPHRGSSKAFRALNQIPWNSTSTLSPSLFNPLYNLLRGWIRNTFHWLDDAFTLITRSISGVWDLLPPDAEPILIPKTGSTVQIQNACAALAWPGWSRNAEVIGEVPKKRYDFYEEILNTGLSGGLPIALAIGDGSRTEYEFNFDQMAPYTIDFNYSAQQNRVGYHGDGTVIADSAKWLALLDPDPNDSSLPNPYLYYETKAGHFGIIADIGVQNWLGGQLLAV